MQAGNEWSTIFSKFSQAKKKPPLPPPPRLVTVAGDGGGLVPKHYTGVDWWLLQVMAVGLYLLDREDGVNIYKMDAKRRINSLSKIDKIFKVSQLQVADVDCWLIVDCVHLSNKG